MEINLQQTITSFETSKKLRNYNLSKLLYVGSPVYHESSGQLYIVTQLDTSDLNNSHLELMILNYKEYYELSPDTIVKAYNAQELGIMLSDYILPVYLDEGWSFMSNDGSAIIKDRFYKTEVEARAEFVLYLLENKVLQNQDVTDIFSKLT